MLKRGPKEKEKILKRLTEKEIQEQLYSFRAREVVLPRQEPVKSAPVVKEAAPQAKNPYVWIQIILLTIFIILIWVSIRQIIKIVSSKTASAAVETQAQGKTGKNSRILQHRGLKK